MYPQNASGPLLPPATAALTGSTRAAAMFGEVLGLGPWLVCPSCRSADALVQNARWLHPELRNPHLCREGGAKAQAVTLDLDYRSP